MASPQPIRFRKTRAAHSAQTANPPLPEEMLAILQALQEGERFLICSHSRPDGDAIGSMLAMGMLLRQMGKRAEIVAADRIPAVYAMAWREPGCAAWSACFTSTSITTPAASLLVR
jgi:hypothetical protein